MERARLSRDTSAAAEQRQFEIWARMSGAEKLELVGQMRADTLALAAAGLRQRHPNASERELFLRLALLTLGPRLARAAYPEIAAWDPA